MNRQILLVAAGLATVVIGFAKTIEPVIEVGVALVIMGWITNPTSKG